MSALETRLTVIETRLDTWKPADKIPDLAEKIGELKNWRCFFYSLRMARRPWGLLQRNQLILLPNPHHPVLDERSN
jgi:hypothetical protein